MVVSADGKPKEFTIERRLRMMWAKDRHEDDALLEGPQFENQGISQADIDALFA